MSTQMEAGRELDALVAEKVFGSVIANAPIGDGMTRTRDFVEPTLVEADVRIREAYAAHVAKGQRLWPAQYIGPEFSTDIAAAWQVVEKVNGEGPGYEWEIHVRPTLAMARITWVDPDGGIVLEAEEEAYDPKRLPEVICRAALSALEAK